MGFLKVTDDASLGVNDQAKELTFEQAYAALEEGQNETEFGILIISKKSMMPLKTLSLQIR